MHLPRRPSLGIVIAAFLAALPLKLHAADSFETEDVAIRVEVLASGLDQPWGMDVLPDDAIVITEKDGGLRILRDGALSKPVRNVPKVRTTGQGGLLDVALSPGFVRDRTLFLTASVSIGSGAGTAVFRARLSEDERRLEDVQEIFRMKRGGNTGRHFGSRIAFGADGTLFFSIGDRGARERAQDPFDHAGKILRIHPDGSIPADNPFADGTKALPEIWSIGHRNAQGVTFDPLTSAILTVEHGDRGGDEVNRPRAGKNYGWPVISYGRHYDGSRIGRGTSAPGLEQPQHYWDPSIAPGALAVYRGDMFPEWRDDLMVASLKFGLVSRLKRDGRGRIIGEERFIDGDYGRLRDVIVAPDGALLLLTDERNGRLLRVTRGDSPT